MHTVKQGKLARKGGKHSARPYGQFIPYAFFLLRLSISSAQT